MGETGMTGTTSIAELGYELRAGAPDALTVSVALAPQQSVLMLLLQAASGQSLGAPADQLAAVRDGLRPQARFAAQSFTTRGWTRIPESCTPISPIVDASVADQVARMRDLPADVLIRDLESAAGCLRWAPHWRGAGDQPRRWLNSFADASLDTWAVAEPQWRAAGPLVDREIRRVGIAAVRGGMAALLNSLHPGIRYRDGMFVFSSQCGRDNSIIGPVGPVGSRRLALLPLIAGRNAVMFSFERPDVCYIGYPVPRPHPDLPDTAESALATILGPVRAAILQALRHPLTVNDVAAAVHCAPTTATYHLHHLSAAGLITREKSGPSVWVSRAVRGDELVDLLSD